ncbi:MAG: RNA chaperone Hfq [Candidatus Poribacteria bacterium]|nr:RNA chaperone Hfq [Candidatus Poribacteria bacterium]
MSENSSPEFAPGQIVFLKSNPSTRGAVVEVLTGSSENQITIFADGRIQSFDASQLQVSTSSDILSRIIDASPETIEQIETLLQSPAESTPTISPAPQEEPSVASAEPSEKQQKESQPSKKEGSNWDSDKLLSQYFAQPVRFITYTGIKDLSEIRAEPYTLWGTDTNGKKIKMAKLQALFAFPKEKMPDLKPYVKVRQPLKAQNLQPIETPEDRFHIDDDLLKQARENKSNVNIVTRAGYVLNGWLQHFDEYVLYMRVGEKVVVVYRHGLFEFTITEQES